MLIIGFRLAEMGEQFLPAILARIMRANLVKGSTEHHFTSSTETAVLAGLMLKNFVHIL